MRGIRFVVALLALTLTFTPALSQNLQTDIAPIAATLGQPVILDPTDGLAAPGFTTLRPEWAWVSRPVTSVADFDATTVLRPRFTPDVNGTYVAQLSLFDAAAAAGSPAVATARIEVGTGNLTPVARIDARGLPGGAAPLMLDGTGSFDVNGDALSYVWSLEAKPAGSLAAILDAGVPLTRLSLDVEGFYTVGLRVQDAQGALSPLAQFAVKHLPVQGPQVAPVARAGFDQLRADAGAQVRLDAYRSTDLNGGALLAEGYVTVAPTGVAPAYFTEAEAVQVSNLPAPGDYLLAVQAKDALWTSVDQVLVSVGPAGSVRPVARIAPVAGTVGAALVLDGTQSHDFDGDLLDYRWALLHRPVGSTASIGTATAPEAGLIPDVAGLYVVQLQVADVRQASVPVTFALQVAGALPVAEAGPDRLAKPGTQALDGTGSTATSPVYAWAALDLVGQGGLATFSDAAAAQPVLTLPVGEARFRDVIQTAPVYHFKRSDTGGLCQFDTRLPGDMPGALASEGISVTLISRGLNGTGPAQKRVWEVENKKNFTRTFTLQTTAGVVLGTWVLPGRVSVHVTTALAGTSSVKAVVGNVQVATASAKTSPFNRNNPVCSGDGSQVVQLTVQDANGISLPDTVLLGAGNQRPVLARSARLVLAPGVAVALTAADVASDVNGDALTFGWSLLARPAGSAATIDPDPAVRIVAGGTLSFAPDTAGLYLIQLAARDGARDATPVVFLIDVPNTAPVAVATGPGSVFVGQLATLDGTASFDPDANALTFEWSVTARPAGSVAVLTDATAPVASFTPDLRGDYAFALIVRDFSSASAPASVTLAVPNRAPVAALAPLDPVFVGDDVILSALASSDADGDALTYAFAVLTAPAGSTATLVQAGPGEAEFTADRAGDYRVQVTVSDGVASAVAELAFTAGLRNAAPVLADLDASYTVELGLKLHLPLQGTDPDGDVLTYFATPLPLPTGMTVNATSGLISFRPELGQLGNYTFTFGVSDGILTDTQTVTVVVVPADAGDTAITGRVLDATDFAAGTTTPLAGIPVRLRDAALATVTAADGTFSFGSLSRLSDQVLVEPASGQPDAYVGTARVVRITANQIRDLDPDFLLARLTDGCATVTAGAATVLAGATSGVTVSVPADSITTTAGAPYTGQVCLGSLPQLFAQPGLPENTDACRIYALSAPGAVFTQALTISAPNLDLLPEQTRLELWRMAGTTATFRRAANASVDAGGATVSTQLSGVVDGGLFTFLPQAPLSVAAADQPTGNRSLTPFTGDLSETYALPGYRAFNRDQQVALTYHSAAADPTVIVAGAVTVAADASLPVSLSTRLAVGGLAIDGTAVWTPRLGLDGSVPALIGEAVTLRQSLPVDATGLDSGRYGFDFVSRAQYGCSTVASSHRGQIYVQNEATSPYGNGWSVNGLQKLVLGEDGSVAIIDDDSVVTFDAQPTLTEFDDTPLVFPTIGTQSVDIVDYDGDGQLDVAYAASGTGSAGLIRGLGGRDMVFDRSIVFANTNTVGATGSYIPNLLEIAAGDLSNDGSPDLGFALQIEDQSGYLRNDGFGQFTEVVLPNMPTGGVAYRDVAIVDLNGDGFRDFVRLNLSGSVTTQVIVSYGNATGIAAPVVVASRAQFGSPLQMEIADIDGNGRLDVMWRGETTPVNLAFQNTNGSFTVVVPNPAFATSPINLLGEYTKLADVNGDGRQDIVWSGTDNLTVFRNLATTGRTFAPGVVLPRPPFATSAMFVHIADANGDGIADIVASAISAVAVYLGNGDGTFQPFETGFVDYAMSDLAFADIDGDGSLDMVSAQRFSVTVHFSKPSATGKFVAGKGEYSSLTRLPDGSYARRYKDGSTVLFNASGLQTAEVDAQGNLRSFAYGPDGRLATITDQVGGVTAFFYDDAIGRLSRIVYPDGRETLFSYDDQGNMAQITEPEGAVVGFSYDVNNRLVSTTNQNGNTSSYTSDATGLMNGATLPDGSAIRNQVAASLGLVDGLGAALPNPLRFIPEDQRATTVTDRKGQITLIEVNQFGATVKVTDPLGRVTSIERDDGNLAVRVERPSATGGVRVDTIAYDALANVTSMTEAAGTPQARTTQYEYEPVFNKTTRMVDPGGFATLYAYDATGLVTQITDAAGGLRQFSYLPDGMLASRSDENGNATAFVYGATKNLSQITYADGSVTAMTYDTRGNATVIAEGDGLPEERQIRRAYDNLNRIRSMEVTGADGIQIAGITSYAYDPAGNLATVTDETGLVTGLGYDPLERLVTLDDPAEGLISRTYNPAGEVIAQINGDGETHVYAYDAVSRLTQTTDPEGYVKSFGYDVRDNVNSVTDGQGGLTSFTYDVLDRMLTRTNPIGEVLTRAYDSRDNLTRLTREDGTFEVATYDGLKRRTQVTTPDNTLTYAFDLHSNLTLAADNDSRVTFTYDDRNRLATTTTDGTIGPQPAVTLTYAYDALDRRATMSDSLGGSTSYDWDAEDRLASLTAPWGTVYSFGYDGKGRRTALTSTSGRASSYGYTNGLLTALTHAQSGVTLTDLTYGYGTDGQLTAILDNLDPTKSEAISYDALNRLVQVAAGLPVAQGGVPIPVEDYAYDGEGNRTASHLSAVHSSNDHNQLLEDDTYTYAYDAKGNRVSRTAKAGGAVESYTYDSQNRLVGYSGASVASYAYDALDRRIAKTVDGVTEAFVYDGMDPSDSTTQNIGLTFRAGQLIRRWLFGPNVDEPIAFETHGANPAPGTGSVIELFANRLGSIITAVSVSTGAIAAEYDYDSYGTRTQTGALEQPYGFTGREHDAESGLIYYRARSYDPVAGAFVQSDPIGFGGRSFGLYNYAASDPVNKLDPSGHITMAAEANNIGLSSAALGVGATGIIYDGLVNGPLNQIMYALLNSAVYSTSDDGSSTDTEATDGNGDSCKPKPPSPSWWEKRKRDIRNLLIPFMEIFGLVQGYAEKGQNVPKLEDIVAPIEEARRKMDEWQDEDNDDNCR